MIICYIGNCKHIAPYFLKIIDKINYILITLPTEYAQHMVADTSRFFVLVFNASEQQGIIIPV